MPSRVLGLVYRGKQVIGNDASSDNDLADDAWTGRIEAELEQRRGRRDPKMEWLIAELVSRGIETEALLQLIVSRDDDAARLLKILQRREAELGVRETQLVQRCAASDLEASRLKMAVAAAEDECRAFQTELNLRNDDRMALMEEFAAFKRQTEDVFEQRCATADAEIVRLTAGVASVGGEVSELLSLLRVSDEDLASVRRSEAELRQRCEVADAEIVRLKIALAGTSGHTEEVLSMMHKMDAERMAARQNEADLKKRCDSADAEILSALERAAEAQRRCNTVDVHIARLTEAMTAAAAGDATKLLPLLQSVEQHGNSEIVFDGNASGNGEISSTPFHHPELTIQPYVAPCEKSSKTSRGLGSEASIVRLTAATIDVVSNLKVGTACSLVPLPCLQPRS